MQLGKCIVLSDCMANHEFNLKNNIAEKSICANRYNRATTFYREIHYIQVMTHIQLYATISL